MATSGTFTFAAGETNKQIAVQLLNDATSEPEEQFSLVLTNPTAGVSLGNSTVVIRIHNDDPVPAPPGRVAWWSGEGDAEDILGAHHGAVIGSACFIPGVVGRGFLLQEWPPWYVRVEHSADLDLTNVTVEAWVQLEYLSDGWRRIVHKPGRQIAPDYVDFAFDIQAAGLDLSGVLNPVVVQLLLGPCLHLAVLPGSGCGRVDGCAGPDSRARDRRPGQSEPHQRRAAAVLSGRGQVAVGKFRLIWVGHSTWCYVEQVSS